MGFLCGFRGSNRRMNFSSLKRRAGLQARFLVPVITIMALVTGVSIWIVNDRAGEGDYRVTLEWLLGAGLLGIALAALAIRAVSRRINSQLAALRDHAEAVGGGDFSRRAKAGAPAGRRNAWRRT